MPYTPTSLTPAVAPFIKLKKEMNQKEGQQSFVHLWMKWSISGAASKRGGDAVGCIMSGNCCKGYVTFGVVDNLWYHLEFKTMLEQIEYLVKISKTIRFILWVEERRELRKHWAESWGIVFLRTQYFILFVDLKVMCNMCKILKCLEMFNGF